MNRRLAIIVTLAAAIGVSQPLLHGDGPQDRRLGRPDGQAERRLALVIGNDGYTGAALTNAVNDARAVSSALKQLAFDVQSSENTSGEEFARAVDQFIGRIQPGDVAVFYYSGHGVQVQGVNYLIPVDFRGADEVSLKFRTVSVTEIDERLERRGARVRILILDACRDNPFRGTRSGGGGLAAYTAEGALIAYATGAGATASDNTGASNGLFTSFFLEALKKPGVTATDLFKWVRVQVREKSGGRQMPWLHDGLIGEFVFNAGVSSPATPAPPAPAPRPSPPAPTRTRSAPKLTFATPAGLLVIQVKPDQTAAFNALVRAMEGALRETKDALLQRQGTGLRFFQSLESMGSNALYVAVIDPAVSGGEYSFAQTISNAAGVEWDNLPWATQDIVRRGIASAESINQVSLTPILVPSRRPGPPPSVTGPAPRLSFLGNAGALLVQIKPDQVDVFEAFVRQLEAGFAATTDPVLAEQAAGLRIYKSTDPMGSNALFVIVANPVITGADYDLFSLMQRTMTPEQLRAPDMTQTWARWQAAFAGLNKLNLFEVSLSPLALGQPTRVGGQIAAPKQLKRVEPAYPNVAVAARVQGIVTIEATIDKGGRVVDATILRSIPLLDQAALDAVRQWEYEPTYVNGVAVPVIMTVTVNFSLR